MTHFPSLLLILLPISRFVFWPYFAGVLFSFIAILTVRKEFAEALRLDKVVILGRMFFAVPLAVFAAEHFVSARFVMSGVPPWMPGPLFWAYFVGVALIAAALSIIVKRQVRLSATLLAIMFFLFVLLIHAPRVVANPRDRFDWALALRELAFGGGALAFAGTQTEEWRAHGRNQFITLGRFLIAIATVFFGVENLLHPDFAPGVPLRKLTPTWIPGRLIWAYLTGLILIAAGTSILVKKKTRTEATCVGVMILLLVVFIYLPIMVATWFGTGSAIEGLNYFADTLLFGGTALFLAGATPRNDRSPKQ